MSTPIIEPTPARSWRCSRPALLCAVPFALTLVMACGPPHLEVTPATIDGDKLLFERGEQALEQGDWIEARDSFSRVRDNYPQSSLRADARLGVADSFEGRGSRDAYLAALAEYQDFLSLFPTHPRAAYAQFKIGMVHFHQMRGPERDQSDTRSAIQEFEVFLQRYPNSDLIGEVQDHLREARDRLSESEYYVGRYYYQREWWPGAIDRLRAVITADPDYTGREEVYFQLADALYRSEDSVNLEEARTWFDRLLDEFPQTLHALKITAALADIDAQLAAAPAPTESDGDNADDDDDNDDDAP